jgi:predicted Kef-type K+ transport protein
MQSQGVPDGYLERNPTAASVLLVIAVGIMVLAVYLLPSIAGRRKQKAGAITWLNLLLGWTVIGWVVVMLWAIKADDGRAERRAER